MPSRSTKSSFGSSLLRLSSAPSSTGRVDWFCSICCLLARCSARRCGNSKKQRPKAPFCQACLHMSRAICQETRRRAFASRREAGRQKVALARVHPVLLVVAAAGAEEWIT
eukprot:786678-Pyramimonas_sp.AAC.1